MFNERPDRRTSILRNPDELGEVNRTNGGGVNRRVSFHTIKTVQHFDAVHGNFQEQKNEQFSLSSISSADEATKHSSINNQGRLPLATLNNTEQNQEVRRPLDDRKKPYKSMGTDDTRLMCGKGNDQSNLTLQFGARPSISDTLSDDNTQALFAPAPQTCTEAFFEQIRGDGNDQMAVDNAGLKSTQDMTMNNDVTADFLELIANQGRQAEPAASNSIDDDTLAGGISSASKSSVTQQYNQSEYGVRLENTQARPIVPMRDETFQTIAVQRDEGQALIQTFANSFQPEISSYVLHENSDEKDECKSIRGDLSLFRPPVHQQLSFQPSFTFGNTSTRKPIDFEEDNTPFHVEEQGDQDILVESISPNVLRDEAEMTAELSKQVTLYDDMGFELRDRTRKPTINDPMDTLPAIMTQSIFLENSQVLGENDDRAEKLCDSLNQTVEMADEQEPSIQLNVSMTQNCDSEQLPNNVVQTPVVKAQESVTPLSTMNDTKLSEGSDTLHKKLNKTREKLDELEDKVANRRSSANFKQILDDARLNRSMAISPGKPEPGNCPPVKQARIFNNPMESPNTDAVKSVHVPTVFHRTPQPSTHKSQQYHKVPSALKVLSTNRNALNESTPTRQNIATPAMPNFTSQGPAHRRNAPNSVLRAVINTPNVLAPITESSVDFNPLHGPVQLKSLEYIKWAQKLKFDPNWLVAERVPKWNPLPDDYFDRVGLTAGQEKTDLKRRADRIVIRTINNFDGNMYKIRQYLWDLAQVNAAQAQPYKDKMLELREQHDNLVDKYNARVIQYNQLIKHMDAKKHAEVEKFLDDIRHKIRDVIAEWKSDN